MSDRPGPPRRFGSTGRSPLFAALRRDLALARLANRPGAPPVGELVEMDRHARHSRRTFLKAATVGAAASALAGLDAPPRAAAAPPASIQQARRGPRVVIVGAGLAGLNAAFTLKNAGVRAAIYSAEERLGGRVATARDLLGPGLTTEVGGEFIDSGHQDILRLARLFDLTLIDLGSPSEADLRVAYEFDGRSIREEEIVEAFRPLAARLDEDYVRVGGFPVTFLRKNRAAERRDRTSLREYLEQIGASGFLFKLLDVAYVTEFGLDSDEQSCLNLIFLIGTDVSEGFQVFGASDERFKVLGGNDRIVQNLAARLGDQIVVGHRLVAIRSQGRGYVLTFQTPTGPSREVPADTVLLAIPFTILREVDIRVDLPPFKQRAIRELGYGKNAKLFGGYRGRPWRNAGLSGDSFTDAPYQLSWDNSRLQPAPGGGLTLYLGGAAALAAGGGTDEQAYRQHLPDLERAFPGSSALLNGRFGRAFWPGNPFIQASYACYRPGQYTTIAGAEIRPVGNLFFAGEHCSLEFQGYMNGAAQTGRVSALALLNRLRRP